MTVAEQTPVPTVAAPAAPQREVMYRHSVVVRVTHWVNALCLVLLLMSGLRIFNYHPSLYWGNYGYRGVPSFISITSVEDSETDELTGNHAHRPVALRDDGRARRLGRRRRRSCGDGVPELDHAARRARPCARARLAFRARLAARG